MASLQLQDKVILITGALGAAGRAAVELLLEKGAKVAAADILSADAFTDLEHLQKQFGKDRLLYISADLMDEEQVKDAIERTGRYFGRLDGSYHNVYVNKYRTIAQSSLQEWEDSIRGTLTSTFLVCKYAAQLMIASGGGSIVNTSSILGSKPRTANGAYAAGKAGLEQLTRVIAYEYAEYGIRANAVVPGDFKSEKQMADMPQHHLDNMKRDSLIGRIGTPNEINEVAAFLLSDAASYVTGALFPVDGGLWI